MTGSHCLLKEGVGTRIEMGMLWLFGHAEGMDDRRPTMGMSVQVLKWSNDYVMKKKPCEEH